MTNVHKKQHSYTKCRAIFIQELKELEELKGLLLLEMLKGFPEDFKVLTVLTVLKCQHAQGENEKVRK